MDFEQFSGADKYIPDPGLVADVNAAIALQRPLLVRGEPGTGKTMLAHAVAEGLGRRLMTWHVKSTTIAQEGLYHYDVVQRLNDARFAEVDGIDVSDIRRYIRMGVLGQAFRAEDDVVLLIDEIDKADVEFPNDLLRELDEMAFHVPELDETVRAIVTAHLPQLEEGLVSAAIERFYGLRRIEGLRKKPSTSELLDWLMVLSRSGADPQDILKRMPYLGVLVKQERDLDLLKSRRVPWA
jgi:MoxR-like ATPase